MNILILTHNFTPDLGAASFRMDSVVRELSKRGHIIYVVTARPNRYNNLNVRIKDDFKSNVKIFRIKNKKQSNNFINRSVSYIEYFIKSYFVSKRLLKDIDIIIATSPQILTGFLGAILSRKSKLFVLDIRDLWPDAMIDLNITSKESLVYKILKKIEIYMYRKANKIIINSPDFEKNIKPYSNKKIDLITNGIDDYIYDYFKSLDNSYPIKNRKIKILYAGNLGIAQDLKILTNLNFNTIKDFEFYLIGNGSQKKEIENELNQKKIKNIILIPPKKREELLKEYEKCDAFFVHLRDIPMFEKTIPSKIFEYIATKKPVVYGLKGTSKKIMDELEAGYSFEPGNIKSLEKTLLKLKESLYNRKWKYKRNELLEKKYLRSKLSKKFADIIENTYYENNK